jgi:NADH-quinone oxidoreductase subunit M
VLLGVVRLDVLVLSDAMRWAAPAIVTLGAAGAIYGALVATAERELVNVVAFGFVSLSGITLVGLGSLTSQAMLGAFFEMAAAGCACGVALLVLGALRDRTGTTVSLVVRGIGIEAPMLAAAMVLSALAVGGIPGSWAAWLVGVGTVVRDVRTSVVVLVAAVLLAASQMLPVLTAVRGRLPDSLRRSEALTAYGGHLPDLRPYELGAIAPLILLLLLLGFYPTPLIGRAQATARDMSELVAIP